MAARHRRRRRRRLRRVVDDADVLQAVVQHAAHGGGVRSMRALPHTDAGSKTMSSSGRARTRPTEDVSQIKTGHRGMQRMELNLPFLTAIARQGRVYIFLGAHVCRAVNLDAD